MFFLKGGSMGRHHMGPIQKQPDRRSCLNLTANASVGWDSDCFSSWFNQLKFPSKFSTFKIPLKHMALLSHLWWVLVLRKFRGRDFIAHTLVNFYSCQNRVLNRAIRENIGPVELAQYGKIPYWASFTGRIFFVLPSWGIWRGSS